MKNEPFEIDCPCCSAKLIVDRASGEVLLHEKPAATKKRDLLAMMNDLDSQKSEREKAFERQMSSQKERQRILEEKFREAFDRADKDGSPMPGPLDLD